MKKDTLVTIAGRDPKNHKGMVNTPIYQSSTILFSSLEEYLEAEAGRRQDPDQTGAKRSDLSYGIGGTPTTFALQDAMCELENGEICCLTSSGLSAITLALQSIVSAGDHILVSDSVYGPTRRFCNTILKRCGVETQYYNPRTTPEELKLLLKPNTKVIFMESAGSLTFEMQDVPGIAALAKQHGIITICDNSWATPLYFSPLDAGVDISIQAITKYIGGHSDLLMGAATGKKEIARKVLTGFRQIGHSVSSFDVYLALRGLRSLGARMKQHHLSTIKVLDFLKTRTDVVKILHPADVNNEGHSLWKRDILGTPALFAFILDNEYSKDAICDMINKYKYFGIGASWGGFESLALSFPAHEINAIRPTIGWSENRTYVRLFIGLEDPEDLIEDIRTGLDRIRNF